MRILLDQSQLLRTLRSSFGRARKFQIATALVTRSGLGELVKYMSACLAGHGSGEVLIGIDMPTEPEAIQRLLELQAAYPEELTVKRFNSGPGYIFHPKLWTFTLKSGRSIAVVGSSNLTHGGLLSNYEANVLIDRPQSVAQVIDHFDEHFVGARAKGIDADWLTSYSDLYKRRRRLEAESRNVRQKVRKLDEKAPVPGRTPRRVAGHSFAFTGKINGWPRENKLYPTVTRFGGTPAKQVWGSVDYLVHGDILGGRRSTRKLREARRLGVELIDQDQFLKILDRERARRRSRGGA